MNVRNDRLVIERLTALWALNECGLGGFMHAFGTPFTGIVVGGISILLITLIASHTTTIAPTLIKALSIVLLVKLSVSPHSPITAYIAVSFQAFLGILLFYLFSVNSFTILLLGCITFLESAVQKIITLTIVYGHSLWDAIDVYSAWVSDSLAFIDLTVSSKTLIVSFISFYALVGIIVGLLIIRVKKLIGTVEASQFSPNFAIIHATSNQKKLAKRSYKLALFWVITLVIIMLPLFFLNNEFGGVKKGLYVVARSLIILVLWYKIIGPLVLKGLHKFLSKRKSAYKIDIQNTFDLLPYLRTIIRYAWLDSSSLKGIKKMQYFIVRGIVYSIHFNPLQK